MFFLILLLQLYYIIKVCVWLESGVAKTKISVLAKKFHYDSNGTKNKWNLFQVTIEKGLE